MAKYTTELRTLIKNGFDIGLNDYPIFDENYRPILNKKIVDHYYFSEIGFETAAMFKHYLNATMREIMPVYNKMYLTDNLIDNPLRDFDETTEETRNKTGAITVEASAEDSSSSSGTTSGSNSAEDSTTTETTGLSVHSDTPQGQLTDAQILANNWASSADRSSDGVTSGGSSSGSSSSEYSDSKSGSASSSTQTDSTIDDIITKHYYGYGKGKAPAELLRLYRENLINIDLMIIKELESCFMMIY